MSLANATVGSVMPVVVTRLIISLRKTASSPSTIWSAGQAVSTVSFAQHTIGGSEHGIDLPLRSIVGKRRSVSDL